eukprot:SAG22_NODE_2341_length_2687_cov_4.174652_3_plen_43_part_00
MYGRQPPYICGQDRQEATGRLLEGQYSLVHTLRDFYLHGARR